MSGKKTRINIKPFGLLDLLEFKKLIPSRKKRIDNASERPINEKPPVNMLAQKLHPERQFLIITEVIEESLLVKTFRLVPDKENGTMELAFFRPGQYLSFSLEIEGNTVTRPYSISSSPSEALKGLYEVTVKRNEGGYVSNYIWENWAKGTRVVCSGPQGHFYFDELRDSRKMIGIAGGCGITPFRSMARSIIDGSLDIQLTLFFGCNTRSDMIYRKEFAEMEEASAGRIKVINVLCNEKNDNFEYGYITAGLLNKYAKLLESSIFICGPQPMYEFVRKELKNLGLRKKYIRWELFGEIRKVRSTIGFPQDKAGLTFDALIHMGAKTVTIPVSSEESLLVAMERAGISPPSSCRSGMCGYCRSLLIEGDVFIPEDQDGRRMADKQFGFIHPCSSFPLSYLEIVIPRER